MNDITIYKQKFWKEKPEWETKYAGTTHSIDDVIVEESCKGDTLKELANNLATIFDLDIKTHHGFFKIDYKHYRGIEVYKSESHNVGSGTVKRRSLNFLERKLLEFYLKRTLIVSEDIATQRDKEE